MSRIVRDMGLLFLDSPIAVPNSLSFRRRTKRRAEGICSSAQSYEARHSSILAPTQLSS
jgi:hypothetical protein